jgi:hypothetical protein
MRPRPVELVCGVLAALAVWMSARGASETFVVVFAILAGLVLAVCACVEVATTGARDRRVRSSAWLAGSFLMIASIGITHWPLRVSYALSRGAFDEAARRVRAGEELEMPQLIGLFTIRRGEISDRGSRGQVACLWTDLEPNGFTGFVQWPARHPPFNIWSELFLDDGWQFISED